ncbi:MAG: hypothetical protein ABSG53_10340 [Thermoguttaceae bacterium]|jgi:hypothetical protein
MLRPCWLLIALTCLLAGTARSADIPQVEGEAPAGQESLQTVRGGAIFVDTSLKEQYNRLLSRVRTLQADLDAERIDGAEAFRELEDLQTKLKRLRDEIEKKKVLVLPGKFHKQSETSTLDLGPARMLFIEADNLHLEGWDGPQVKCVLEKTVIAPDNIPVDEHLRGIKLVHRHGFAPNLVGKTPAERDADEKMFLASAEGQKLNEQQRESRQQVVREIVDSYHQYRAFQGKQFDSLEIEGLSYQQGNRQVSFDIRSGNTVRVMGSEWQRYASLTVYVPTCQAVAVRGCAESLDVQGVHGELLVNGHGDNGNNSSFRVRDLYGLLNSSNVPLELVESIHGNVNILSTITSGPTDTGSRNGERIFCTPAPRALTCRNVDGDLIACVTRDELNLEAITGRIDVKNEFGKTTLAVGRTLADKRHRVVSESGRIEVRIAPGARGRLPICAMTNCGAVRYPEAEEEILHGTTYALKDNSGIMRMWGGALLAHGGPSPSLIGALNQRDAIEHVVLGDDHSPALFLFSRSGTVQILYQR